MAPMIAGANTPIESRTRLSSLTAGADAGAACAAGTVSEVAAAIAVAVRTMRAARRGVRGDGWAGKRTC